MDNRKSCDDDNRPHGEPNVKRAGHSCAHSMRWLLPLLAVMLVACSASPSESDVQTAIAQTAEAVPTNTPTPESTATPEVTPTPQPSPTPDCEEATADALARLEPLFSEWDDTVSVASSTSRISLSGPVSDLQDVRRQVSGLNFPSCSEWRQEAVVTYMDYIINGFIEFMQENERASDFNLDVADILSDGLDRAFDVTRGQFEPPLDTRYIAYSTRSARVLYVVARGDVADMQFSGLWDKVVPSLTDPSEAGVKVLASSGRPARCLIVINGLIYDEDAGSGAATCGATME